MLHVLQSSAAAAPDELLRSMFAARKRVFVDLLKWNVPVLNGCYEIDQYDNEHAIYLILADEHGTHLGSARLLSSTRPHILGELFPQLSEGPVPTGSGTWEITRFCLDRNLSARARREVRDALVLALARYAFSNGIERYTAVAEMAWVQQILAFGWECMPLGLARDVDGEMLAALEIRIDATTASRLAAAGIADRLPTSTRELESA